jgi:hypothetical protein
MPDQCRLKLAWQAQPNRSTQYFTFRPGPVDWQPGHTLDFGELDGVQLKVLRFLRHAGSEETLVEVSAGKTRQQVWLQRSDENYGFQLLQTKQGPLFIGLDYERLPLGFELKLLKFRHGKNPGQMGDASFASTVELVDRAKGIDRQRTISMNEPLVYGKYALYQSSFKETPEGKQASSLTVACDPGRLLKYVGSLMICGGAFLMFFCRAIAWKTIPFLPSGRKSDHGAPTVNSRSKPPRTGRTQRKGRQGFASASPPP